MTLCVGPPPDHSGIGAGHIRQNAIERVGRERCFPGVGDHGPAEDMGPFQIPVQQDHPAARTVGGGQRETPSLLPGQVRHQDRFPARCGAAIQEFFAAVYPVAYRHGTECLKRIYTIIVIFVTLKIFAYKHVFKRRFFKVYSVFR